MGRRVKKVVGSVTTYYFYDGWQCVMEKDSTGVTRFNTFGLGLDDILSTTVQNGDTVYFHKNYLGSVTSMTDNTGSVLESVRYDIHGTPTIFDAEGAVIMSLPDPSGTLPPFLYTGQRYDAETGLYYYKNRYYSPELGRFLSLDPAGEVDGMNLYAYVMGNPMNGTDPMGLKTWDYKGWRISREGKSRGLALALSDGASFSDLVNQIGLDENDSNKWREIINQKCSDSVSNGDLFTFPNRFLLSIDVEGVGPISAFILGNHWVAIESMLRKEGFQTVGDYSPTKSSFKRAKKDLWGFISYSHGVVYWPPTYRNDVGSGNIALGNGDMVSPRFMEQYNYGFVAVHACSSRYAKWNRLVSKNGKGWSNNWYLSLAVQGMAKDYLAKVRGKG